jgi:hypothetical protein
MPTPHGVIDKPLYRSYHALDASGTMIAPISDNVLPLKPGKVNGQQILGYDRCFYALSVRIYGFMRFDRKVFLKRTSTKKRKKKRKRAAMTTFTESKGLKGPIDRLKHHLSHIKILPDVTRFLWRILQWQDGGISLDGFPTAENFYMFDRADEYMAQNSRPEEEFNDSSSSSSSSTAENSTTTTTTTTTTTGEDSCPETSSDVEMTEDLDGIAKEYEKQKNKFLKKFQKAKTIADMQNSDKRLNRYMTYGIPCSLLEQLNLIPSWNGINRASASMFIAVLCKQLGLGDLETSRGRYRRTKKHKASEDDKIAGEKGAGAKRNKKKQRGDRVQEEEKEESESESYLTMEDVGAIFCPIIDNSLWEKYVYSIANSMKQKYPNNVSDIDAAVKEQLDTIHGYARKRSRSTYELTSDLGNRILPVFMLPFLFTQPALCHHNQYANTNYDGWFACLNIANGLRLLSNSPNISGRARATAWHDERLLMATMNIVWKQSISVNPSVSTKAVNNNNNNNNNDDDGTDIRELQKEVVNLKKEIVELKRSDDDDDDEELQKEVVKLKRQIAELKRTDDVFEEGLIKLSQLIETKFQQITTAGNATKPVIAPPSPISEEDLSQDRSLSY